MSSPKQVSDLLKLHNLRAQKRLGQNFLCDKNILNKIAGAAELAPDDPVLEIGGGLGALTLTLASFSKSITCIEIDQNLAPILSANTAGAPGVKLMFADFLRVDHKQLFEEAFRGNAGSVVANIPYYITTPILEILFEYKRYLRKIVLLVQKEFAARLVAPPGSDECGSLSLFGQYHAEIKLIGIVPRTVFLPPPDVDSAIISLTPVLPGTVPVLNESRMFSMIRAGFGQRRKTLLNALMRAPSSFGLGFGMDDRANIEALLHSAGIDPARRGETLSLLEYATLADTELR